MYHRIHLFLVLLKKKHLLVDSIFHRYNIIMVYDMINDADQALILDQLNISPTLEYFQESTRRLSLGCAIQKNAFEYADETLLNKMERVLMNLTNIVPKSNNLISKMECKSKPCLSEITKNKNKTNHKRKRSASAPLMSGRCSLEGGDNVVNYLPVEKRNFLDHNHKPARGRGRAAQLSTMTEEQIKLEADARAEKNRQSSKRRRAEVKAEVQLLRQRAYTLESEYLRMQNEIQVMTTANKNQKCIIEQLKTELMYTKTLHTL